MAFFDNIGNIETIQQDTEYEIGICVKSKTGVLLKVVNSNNCYDCFFVKSMEHCKYKCISYLRKDNTDIIYNPV